MIKNGKHVKMYTYAHALTHTHTFSQQRVRRKFIHGVQFISLMFSGCIIACRTHHMSIHFLSHALNAPVHKLSVSKLPSPFFRITLLPIALSFVRIKIAELCVYARNKMKTFSVRLKRHKSRSFQWIFGIFVTISMLHHCRRLANKAL